MAVDQLESYVKRDGIQEDTDFLIKEFKKALAELDKLDKAKIDLKQAKSLTAAGEAAAKVKVQLDELNRIEQQVIKTQEKRHAANSQQAKDLIAEKELLRERNLELKNTVKETLSATNSIDKMRAELNLLTQKKNKLNVDSSEYKEAEKAALSLTNKLKALESAAGDNRRNVGNYSGALKTLEKALVDVRAKMDAYTASGKVSQDTIEALRREETLLLNIVDSQANGFASATAELKNNEKALQALQNAGLQATDFYKDLLKETAALKDNVGDLKQEIQNLASDTSTLDGMIQGAETLAGVYGIAQGAAALFGEENEELQKTLVKLQAVSVILNGLQSIRNALQAQSSLMLLLQTARTTALTVATRVYTFATGGATAAARTFNTVLIAGGIGIAITLIAAAANAMGLFGDETEETTDSIEEQSKAIDELNRKILETADATERVRNSRKGGLDELNRELKLLEAQGASEKDLHQQRLKILNAEEFNLGVRRASIEENGKIEVELDKEIADKKTEIQAEQLAYNKRVADENNRLAKDSADKQKDLMERNRQYQEKERAAQFDLLKLQIQDRINIAKEESGSELIGLSGRIAARQKAFEQERILAIAERDFILSNSKTTNTERLVAEEEFRQKEIALSKQTASDIIDIEVAFREKVDALKRGDADIAAEQAANLNNQQVSEQKRLFELRIGNIEEQAQLEQKANLEKLKNGLIDEEAYELKKLEIENMARKKSLLAEIDYQKELLLIIGLTPEQEAEALEKLNELRRQLRENDFKDAEENAKKRAKTELEIEQEKNEKLKELGQELKETVFSFLTNGIDREKNEIQGQIDALEEKKRVEIEVANQSITNTVERAAAIQTIEARAAAQKEQLERRKRKLDEERARYERLKNIAEIIQGTASAVVEALPNIPLAAIVAGIGALQLVRAISTPIPKFKHGKNKNDAYEGIAWVDDGGKPEAIIRENGNIEIGTNKPRLTYLKKNDIVLPDARELADMQLRMAIDHTGKLVSGYNQKPIQQPNYEKAFNRLGNRFEQAVKNIPRPVINNGIVEQWVRGNDSINVLNRYR